MLLLKVNFSIADITVPLRYFPAALFFVIIIPNRCIFVLIFEPWKKRIGNILKTTLNTKGSL